MELRDIPSLGHLSEEQLEELQSQCEELRLEPGEELIKKGDEGGKLYFLLDGDVEVYVEQRGSSVVLSRMTAPAVLGELEMLTSQKRSANVRATSSSRVLSATHDDLAHRIEEGDVAVLQAVYGIARVIACRLVAMSEKFVDLEAKSDPERSRELRDFRQKLFSDWSL
jgi:CPA1 family monovalent cation:H+ antiporter